MSITCAVATFLRDQEGFMHTSGTGWHIVERSSSNILHSCLTFRVLDSLLTCDYYCMYVNNNYINTRMYM